MAIDVSGLEFFMPIFSFLFVFIIIYALLASFKVIGDNKGVNIMISLIVAVIFISFSSLRLYVETILPWFVVLLVIVFLVLFLGMFASKDWAPKAGLAWTFIVILGIIFVIAAIYVFNPVLHPDLVVAEGGNGESLGQQVIDFFTSSKVAGSVLLIIIAAIVTWVLTKK
ncbi:MAG: hypothetical protein WC438_02075 [Candidatus Pacearchaeota archaeon]